MEGVIDPLYNLNKSESSIIGLEELSIGYRSKKSTKTVASNLSAELLRGQMICLLGSNGRGKSTLMRSLCGFLSPLAGKVLLNGNDISTYTEKELSRLIAVVLTDRILLPQARVHEVVAFGRSPNTGVMGRLNDEDRAIVQKSMEICQIAFKKNEYYTNLSDGEKQKVNIARALAQDTPLIILDEPTAFLDLGSSVEVMQLLRKLASEEQKAVLMSTHSLDLAIQLADRLWLLEKGGPLLTGSPEDLLLQGAFQKMFDSEHVKFDSQTGLFKVDYHVQHEVSVKGQGFRYTLLARALARKSFKIRDEYTDEGLSILVPEDANQKLQLSFAGELLKEFQSIEEMIDYILSIDTKKKIHSPGSTEKCL